MTWTPTHQQAAVIAHDASLSARLLAGPGTGKSATVIRFMLHAAEVQGVSGRLLTFTRAATNELKGKVAEHPEALSQPSTVHSFSIATLLANPGASMLPQPIRIADDWEWKELIRQHLKELVGCDVRLIDRALREMASNWESLEPVLDPKLPDEVRNQFSGAWEQHRVVFGYSLLAELPYRLLRALEDHPTLDLGTWDYLVVDEYQDLNQCDLAVLNHISDRGRPLIAAGDDDQSIYSFRMAHPVGIRSFLTQYPAALDYPLSVSQRCGTRILECARHVVEGMPGRPARPALTPAAHCPPGEVRYLRFANWTRERAGVATIVEWLIDHEDVAPEDIAVMFRTNYNEAWSGPLTAALTARSIPVVDTSEVPAMLEEDSNRRLLALARLVVYRYDSLAWWTLLSRTAQIGPATRDHFYSRAVSSGTTFAEQLLAEGENGFPDLGSAQRNRVELAISPALEVVAGIDLEGANLGDAGWGTWLVDNAEQFGGCEERFARLLKDLDGVIDRTEGLGRFLGQIQPVGKDLRSGRGAEAVRLMTMASSKGLTVRAAIVVGVEEGVVPLADADVDEERRLLYVAMTRATDYLFLTWAGSRTGPTARTGAPRVGAGRNRSRFLTHGPLASEDGAGFLATLTP
jgi:DNA helicase-2/ATP-dependent DNA helicase PcrA